MLAATGSAIAALLLARLTVIGPGAALHSSLAVPMTGLVPATVVGANVTDCIPIRRKDRLWLRTRPPIFAVTVPFWGSVTGVVFIVNVFFVAPAGTVTVAGIVAEINVSLIGTTRPPAGAGFASVTVAMTD